MLDVVVEDTFPELPLLGTLPPPGQHSDCVEAGRGRGGGEAVPEELPHTQGGGGLLTI